MVSIIGTDRFAAGYGAAKVAQDLLRRYVDAWERVDVDGLVALLREDAEMTMPPLPTVLGADAIGRFFRRLLRRRRHRPDLREADQRQRPPRRRHVAVGGRCDNPHGILLLDIEGSLIVRLDSYLDGPLVELFERTL